ncbi:MAG TPA: TraB/GumN family protein [Capillibacterium sp.]
MVSVIGKDRLRPLTAGLSLLFLVMLCAAGALASLPARPAPALWQVSSETGTVYLLSALNFGNDEFYPLHPKIERVFAACDHLVVSVDLTKIDPEELNASILAAALCPEGMTIGDLLSPADIQRCTEALARYGLSLEQLALFRPWFLLVTIEAGHQQSMGYFPDQSLDIYFLEKAGEKQIIGLENPAGQATLLAELPPATEKRLLLETLDSDLTEETEALITAWWTGDLVKLEAVIFTHQKDPDYFAYYDRIYFRRNRRIVEQIEEFLAAGGSYFLLLPSGHFLGDQGIVALLQTKGYTVERLPLSD